MCFGEQQVQKVEQQLTRLMPRAPHSVRPCAGRFGDKIGLEMCELCPIGHFQQLTNGTSCPGCPAAHFQANVGQAHCVACPENFYIQEESQSGCTACAPGTYSLAAADECLSCSQELDFERGVDMSNIPSVQYCTACTGMSVRILQGKNARTAMSGRHLLCVLWRGRCA